MKFSVGDTVVIQVDVEELQNDLLQMVDGMKATVSEVYQNSYEPDVDRYEVELIEPIEFEDQKIVVVPGLYEDNLEKVESVKEGRVMPKSAFFKRFSSSKKLQIA
jgi:hypothetical protein